MRKHLIVCDDYDNIDDSDLYNLPAKGQPYFQVALLCAQPFALLSVSCVLIALEYGSGSHHPFGTGEVDTGKMKSL